MVTTTDPYRAPALARGAYESPVEQELKREWETRPLKTPIRHPVWPVLAAISIAALLAGLAGAGVALQNWRKVRRERPGSHHRLLDIGEGRPRFLAMWGPLTSLMFLIALVFTSVNLLLVPLCHS